MARPQRIVSLLPSATEMVYALGRGDQLVAVSHECDYPADALTKPKATASLIQHDTLSALEIDIAVRAALHDGGTIYDLDRRLLDDLRPDLILTQEICDVCSVSLNQVVQVATEIGSPRIVSLNPHHLRDVLNNIVQVGEVIGAADRAKSLVDDAYRRIGRVAAVAAGMWTRPRVAVLEWLDPPYLGGLWIPELVQLAGGQNRPARSGETSVRDWGEVLAFQPEVVIIALCGLGLERSLAEARRQAWPAGWADVPAARNGQIYIVDGAAYFSRPGPRLVDSLEILAEILHPGYFAGLAPAGSFCRLHL